MFVLFTNDKNDVFIIDLPDDNFDSVFLSMIRIMHELYTGKNWVAKENFPITMFETDNKGICDYDCR